MQGIAAAYFEPQRILQDLVTGVVVTLIGLIALFAVKPNLRIDKDVKAPSSSDRTDYGFSVTNYGLLTVIEVKAKLFTVDASTGRRSRTYIELEFDEIFRLSGRIDKIRGSSYHLPLDNEFLFRVKEGETIDLSGRKYLVFQVSARHKFTNFTRLKIQRWTRRDNEFSSWDGKKNPFT